jgi:hypothetical protein
MDNSKSIKGVFYDFTKNKNGVTIKKCCASCKHHDSYDIERDQRKCKLSQKIVSKRDCCGCWHISSRIDGIKMR